MPRSPCSSAATPARGLDRLAAARARADLARATPGVGAAFSHGDVPVALPGITFTPFGVTTTFVMLVVGGVVDAGAVLAPPCRRPTSRTRRAASASAPTLPRPSPPRRAHPSTSSIEAPLANPMQLARTQFAARLAIPVVRRHSRSWCSSSPFVR